MKGKKVLAGLTCAALLAAPGAAMAESTDVTLIVNNGLHQRCGAHDDSAAVGERGARL